MQAAGEDGSCLVIWGLTLYAGETGGQEERKKEGREIENSCECLCDETASPWLKSHESYVPVELINIPKVTGSSRLAHFVDIKHFICIFNPLTVFEF